MKNYNNLIDTKTELKNCDAVKTILMLIIVLYHSMVMYAGEGSWAPVQRAEESPIIGHIANWLNSFHIYTFTLVSEYIFYYMKYENGAYQKYIPFVWNKVLRLLVPYVFILVIWVLPVNISFYGTELMVKKFILGVSPNQLWFLLMLFWVFVIFWPISDFVDRKPIVGGICVCLLYFLGMFSSSYFCFYRGLKYTIFFYVGFMMRKGNLSSKLLYKIPSIVYILADLILFIALQMLMNNYSIIIKISNIGLEMLTHLFGAISAFVILQRFINCCLSNNKTIKFLSKHSMVIYLVHQQIIYFLISWFNGVVSPMVLVVINFVFSLVASTMFSVLMHRSRATRVLVGSK